MKQFEDGWWWSVSPCAERLEYQKVLLRLELLRSQRLRSSEVGEPKDNREEGEEVVVGRKDVKGGDKEERKSVKLVLEVREDAQVYWSNVDNAKEGRRGESESVVASAVQKAKVDIHRTRVPQDLR